MIEATIKIIKVCPTKCHLKLIISNISQTTKPFSFAIAVFNTFLMLLNTFNIAILYTQEKHSI